MPKATAEAALTDALAESDEGQALSQRLEEENAILRQRLGELEDDFDPEMDAAPGEAEGSNLG